MFGLNEGLFRRQSCRGFVFGSCWITDHNTVTTFLTPHVTSYVFMEHSDFSEKIGNKICNLRRKTPVSLLCCKVMRCYVACRWHAIIACWVASFYFKIFNQPQTRWVTKRVNNLARTNSYINLDLYQHISSNVSRLSKL